MISKELFHFLSDLKENNNKEWFDQNRGRYEKSLHEFNVFVEGIIKRVGSWDKEISGLDAKKCIFRIYRDVRFAKDKRPYKNNLAASLSPDGKGSGKPGYYIQIEPGHSFVGAGVHMPSPEHLKAIRQEIDYHQAEFMKIISAKEFTRHFDGIYKEDSLKTAPKGYPVDHPLIDILKNKHFILIADLTDKQILSPHFAETVESIFKASFPFDKFLRRAIS